MPPQEPVPPESALVFTKLKQRRDIPQASPRELSLWKREFDKCSTIDGYRHYMFKYSDNANPYIEQAKERIDDLAFAKCKNIEELQRYISTHPSGRHIAEAKKAIENIRFAAEVNRPTSSDIEWDSVWAFIKKAIAVVVILVLLILIYACLTQENARWEIVGGYGVVVVIPVCKWAFDD